MTDLTVLSYGGGVQTFGILLMIQNNIIPKPDVLIFSNTMAEKPETIIHIEQVVKPICEKIKLPFYEVKYKQGLIEGYSKNSTIPNVTNRSCTMTYKIKPVTKKVKELLGYGNKYQRIPKGINVNMMIGFTTDEINRKVENKEHFITNVFPLLDLNLSRTDVINYIKKSNYEVPVKSGCYLCPFIGLKGFTKLKVERPELFKIALDMENDYFEKFPERNNGFIAKTRIKLDDINKTPSLFSFVEQLHDDSFGECKSGGCFL